MNDPFVERIARTRTNKGKKISGAIVETRSQKASEGLKATLEIEIYSDPVLDESRAGRGAERNGSRRLASESTPVEQGQEFATSAGTLYREDMSELSDISTEKVATTISPTDNTMMHGKTEKPATSFSFSERVKNTLENFFLFTMGAGKGNQAETQEDEEDDDEQDDFEYQISLNGLTQENDAYTNRETGSTDRFVLVITKSKTTNGSNQSGDFVTNSQVQPEKNRNAGPSNPPADPDTDYEETPRHRSKTRVSTSTKLPGNDRVTPPLVTPSVNNEASIEEALTNIVDIIGEQNEHMFLRMRELERAVHVKRESLREEFNRNRQEISRSEKRLKEKTDEYLAKNLSRLTREAKQKETRLRDDMDKLRNQQEHNFGTLDTRIDAMMQRRTNAIMDRLDGLLGNRSGSRNGEANSGEPSREARVNFNEQPNRRRTYGSTRGRGSSSRYATGDNRPGAQTSEEVQLATDRPQTNDRRKTHWRLGDVVP